MCVCVCTYVCMYLDHNESLVTPPKQRAGKGTYGVIQVIMCVCVCTYVCMYLDHNESLVTPPKQRAGKGTYGVIQVIHVCVCMYSSVYVFGS